MSPIAQVPKGPSPPLGTCGSGHGTGNTIRPRLRSATRAAASGGGGGDDIHRRSLLQGACIGGAHALAGRGIAAADVAAAQGTSTTDLARQLDERVHEFVLGNGLRFLVAERRAAPVVSFHTYADVGAFDEEDGVTGVAHLLEHLAFKGSPRVGTNDWAREAPLLHALDEVFYNLRAAESPREEAHLRAQLDTLQAAAAALSVPNAYGSLLQREGAVGLNAATSHDATKYYASMPANKASLWFALESERFRAPVFRELYSEKKVVAEERRLRVDNSPLGAFQEQFAQRSLTNNYRRPVIGYASDVERMGRREVADFFQRHYGPASLTVAVVGDVSPSQVQQLAEKYFGGWRSDAAGGPACNGGHAEGGVLDEPLPRPEGARELSVRSRAGPAVLRAWYRPCVRSADSAALDCVSDVLTASRSSRMYCSLVLGGHALSVSSFSSFPAEKHPSQMVVYGVPAPGSSAESLDKAVQAEVAALAAEGPSEGELRRYTKAARMSVLGVLQSNSSLASALASYQALTGGWRGITEDLAAIEALTPGAVREAAGRYLTPDNTFVGYVLPP